MSLRERLSLIQETLSQVAIAADQKYWEGFELLTAGRTGGGIYLMGYSAEMLLKLACFRFDGARPDDLMPNRLHPAKRWMRNYGPPLDCESFHSLIFWEAYLRLRRNHARRALPRILTGELSHRVRRMHVVWWVEMRYRADSADIRDGQRMFQDVTWLRDHFTMLWR